MSPRLARRVMRGVGGFVFVVAVLAPFLWIRPAYQTGQFTAPWLAPQSINANFSDKLMLSSFEIGQAAVSQNKTSYLPGDTVDVLLQWDVQQAMSENWSVFLHLNDPVLGVPVAQRDMYLDQGLRPTSLLQAGETVYNYYELGIPKTAVSPAELELVVGLYNFQTGERLLLGEGGDTVLLDRLMMDAAPGEYPNSVSVNFEDELQLLGYDVNPRQVPRGEPVTLTLYWQAKRPLATDYTFFAQVVDKDTTRYAADDVNPEQRGIYTSTWAEDEVHAVTLTLTPDTATPPNVYPIILGMYTVVDGNFERLQIIAEDGRPTDDFLSLTLLRIE